MANSNPFLNPTLAKWMTSDLSRPAVDCVGCQRPMKCCDFQPFIANFLIGGWLESRSATKLPEIRNVTWQPLGMIPLKEYRKAHQESRSRSADLLCGFYRAGTCSLWSFRPGECSTYFCGESESDPRRVSLSEAAFQMEAAIAQMALAEQGLEPKAMSAQVESLNSGVAENIDGMNLLLMYKQAWKWSQKITREEVQNWLTSE